MDRSVESDNDPLREWIRHIGGLVAGESFRHM